MKPKGIPTHPDKNPIAAYAAFENDHWWFVARRRILHRMIRDLVGPSRDRLVIDVGCGPGGNLASLAAMYRCLGVDTSQAAIDFARTRFPMIDFICGVAPRDIPQQAAAADMWLLMDVLEHVEAADTMLRSIVAAAKPGAIFLITVPADPALWSGHDEAAGHWRRYTQTTLRELWADLPVCERLVSAYNTRLYWPARLARSLNHKLGTKIGANDAEGLDLRMPPSLVNEILAAVFTAEAARLAKALQHPGKGYRRGVSLLAIIERLPGQVEPGMQRVGPD
jgi:SAM-dependent methyltransferase